MAYSLPGGTTPDYDEGRTLTHEAGHWVGLYHTYSRDAAEAATQWRTPLQNVGSVKPTLYATDSATASPAFECPVGRDTCSSAGVDPIRTSAPTVATTLLTPFQTTNNSYTNDSCMNNFTPGQTARLHQQLTAYRGITF